MNKRKKGKLSQSSNLMSMHRGGFFVSPVRCRGGLNEVRLFRKRRSMRPNAEEILVNIL